MADSAPERVLFEFIDFHENSARLTVRTACRAPGLLKSSLGDVDLRPISDGTFFVDLHLGSHLWIEPSSPSMQIDVGRFFPCGRVYRHASFVWSGHVVFWSGRRLCVCRMSAAAIAWRSFCFLAELLVGGCKGSSKAAVVRVAVAILRRFKRRPLWLVSDRLDSGGDNGEALFRHLRASLPQIDTRFVMSSSSPSFRKMAAIGPTVAAWSMRRKVLTLLADCLVSSQAERAFTDPFAGHSEPYRDILAHIPFVFLQHGVTKDDMSGELGRSNRNISGFVVSSARERDSILEGAYGYDADKVWLTGMPRFDLLESRPESLVLVMPTWRLSLTCGRDAASGKWSFGDNFRRSAFFSFYNGLLTDARLIAACRKLGYRMILALHPNMLPVCDSFARSDIVEIVEKEVPYGDLLARGALLVTDYSSTAFDFAYMHKPVVYAQFDADAFFSGGHTYRRGYFDYARDGFGEVTHSLDATISMVVGYMESGCKLKNEYRSRIDGYFAFSGGGNCMRVVERIQMLCGGGK